MLNREEIKKLIVENNLIEGYIDLDVQLAPNGFDFTASQIFEFISPGSLDFSNSERVLPETKEILPKVKPGEEYGWWELSSGIYKVKTNETVNLPKNIAGISFPRSSLLRMGCFTQTGAWDAGFSGKSEFILQVANSKGINLKQNARIIQVLFVEITETKEGYSGIYNKLK